MTEQVNPESTHEYVKYTHLLIVYKKGHPDMFKELEDIENIIPFTSYDEAYKYVREFEASLFADSHSVTIFKRQNMFIPGLRHAELYPYGGEITVESGLIKNPDPEASRSFRSRAPTTTPFFISDDDFVPKTYTTTYLKNGTRDHFYLKTNAGEYVFMPSAYKGMKYEGHMALLTDLYEAFETSTHVSIVDKHDISEVLSCNPDYGIKAQFLSFRPNKLEGEYYGYPIVTEEDLYLLTIEGVTS